jgi:hypothetical protein
MNMFARWWAAWRKPMPAFEWVLRKRPHGGYDLTRVCNLTFVMVPPSPPIRCVSVDEARRFIEAMNEPIRRFDDGGKELA